LVGAISGRGLRGPREREALEEVDHVDATHEAALPEPNGPRSVGTSKQLEEAALRESEEIAVPLAEVLDLLRRRLRRAHENEGGAHDVVGRAHDRPAKTARASVQPQHRMSLHRGLEHAGSVDTQNGTHRRNLIVAMGTVNGVQGAALRAVSEIDCSPSAGAP
jgi:hypothetical protein